jgi:hypothetical protein
MKNEKTLNDYYDNHSTIPAFDEHLYGYYKYLLSVNRALQAKEIL